MPRRPDSDKPLSDFASNLKAAIAHSRLSVNAWSIKHGFTQTTINRIVTGKMDPTLGVVKDIAEKCGAAPWQMLTPGFDPKNPPKHQSSMPFRDLNAFEGQLVTLFRELSVDEQHDHLIELNKRIDQKNGDKATRLNPYPEVERRKVNVPVEVERRGQFGLNERTPRKGGKRAEGDET